MPTPGHHGRLMLDFGFGHACIYAKDLNDHDLGLVPTINAFLSSWTGGKLHIEIS